MTGQLEAKLVEGKKYLVGPKNKKMVYYGTSPYYVETFCAWQKSVGGPIEYMHIRPPNLLLDGNKVRDYSKEYFKKTVLSSEPEDLRIGRLSESFRESFRKILDDQPDQVHDPFLHSVLSRALIEGDKEK